MQNKALPAESHREGQIELLRVVCMLLILAHHMAWHGSAMRSPYRVNQVLSTFLFAGGMTGVNCFVMITGYFLAPFRAKRFFLTALQTLFYSVGLTLLAKYTGWRGDVTGETLRNAALIMTRSPYWFVVMYLGLTAVLPLLQPAVKAMSRNAHLWVLILSALYLSVIPTVTFQNPSSQFFHQFTWFLFLYVLGAYFRKFPNGITRCLPLQGGLFLAAIAFIGLSCLWGNEHQELFQRVGSRQNFFADKNTVPQLLASCALFLFFANLRIKPYKWLTLLSGASFGVYLIHDHSMLRGMIWGNWLQIWTACQRDGFWLTALLAPLGIYLACAVVDLARKYLLEKPLGKWLAPLFAKLDGWLER
ncbi:MAG: acyltransferase [Clostridia bacterium]|nr:acyltransferase [Clostridia bacterium]